MLALSATLAPICGTAMVGGCDAPQESARGKANTNAVPSGGLTDAGQLYDTAYDNTSRLRFVHLVEELGPVDFCYRSIGTTDYSGPILRERFSEADAGSPSDAAADSESDGSAEAGASLPSSSLSPLSASPILAMTTPGTLEIAVITADHPTCSAPLFSSRATLDVGKTFWLVLMGTLADGGVSGLELKRYVSDLRADDSNARIRMIHAANAATNALDIALVGTGETSLARNVRPYNPPAESREPPIDALGYRTIAPLPPPTQFSIRTAGVGILGAWTSAFTDLALTTGSIHTAFVASSSGTFAVLHCSEISGAQCALVRAP